MRLPYLHLYLDLGFFGFRTAVNYIALETMRQDWIVLQWHLFKWKGEFSLYSPERWNHQ